MLSSCNNKEILNIGHRGARGHIAENTLESIQKAIAVSYTHLTLPTKRIV